MKVQRALGLNASNKSVFTCVNIHRLHACNNLYPSHIFTCTCEHTLPACHNLLFVIRAAFRDYSSYILIEEIWSI